MTTALPSELTAVGMEMVFNPRYGLRALATPFVNTAATFDYYVSSSVGADSNAGTVLQPWAITSLSLTTVNAHNVANCNATAGKRVGFLPGTYSLTTAFSGSINSGSNQMTVSGITGAVTVGMALVSGLGSAYSTGTYGWGPTITAIAGNILTLSSNAAAQLTSATIVATFMKQDPVVGAFQIIGGTSGHPTYWGSSNTTGQYSPRTATLDALGGSGVYGGFIANSVPTESGPIIAHTGEYPTTYATSNATLDGLRLTGCSYKCIRIGGASSGDGPSGITGITIQNCEITGNNASANTNTDNVVAIWLDCTTGAVVTNNWFHANVGIVSGSGDHLDAVQLWGTLANTGPTCSGTTIQYNTVVNAGNVYGKDYSIDGTTVANNYLDTTAYSEASLGIQDFTGASSTDLVGTTVFRNNIVRMIGNTAGGNVALGWPTIGNAYGWTTPIQIYNNTVIVVSGGSGVVAWLAGAAGLASYYNNIYVNQSTSGGNWNGYGNFYVNPSSPTLMDYNLNSSPSVSLSWTLYENSSFTTAIGSYSTAAAFAAALASNGGIAGAEAHSLTSAPNFAGTGPFASQYQLQAGSPGKNAGLGGVDMGAWGGVSAPSQIGCNFAT